MQTQKASVDSHTLERIVALDAEHEFMGVENNEDTQDLSVTQPAQSTQKRVRCLDQAPRATRAKKVRKNSSRCWNDFTSVGVESDCRERARCHYCGIKLVIDKSFGTSTMLRHLLICPEKPKTEDRPPYDHKVDREMTAEIIIYHDLPFSYVEYEKVRERDKFLNPECEPICRQTASADVYKKYEVEKLKLKEMFANYRGRMSFTSDLWTSRSQVRGYICLTAHYIDYKWNLHSHILAFCDLKPPHSGEVIAKKIFDILKDWGLERKVFSITLDNASANDNMQKIHAHRLQSGNGLLCDGKYLHVRCCAHILNLIVKKGLELGSSLLVNIRESVKFVKASDSRKDSFATCVKSVGIISGAGLSLDVDTRRNSTYEMLVRALKFRRAFSNLHLLERNYKSLPSQEEWERGEKIRDFLKPFSIMMTYFSRVKYPTANVYFVQVWKIELLLRKYARCADDDMRIMAQDMKSKFTKYWNEHSDVLAMAAVLDPRIKLEMLKEAYNKLDSTTSETKVDNVRKNLELLYKEYSSKSSESSSKISTRETPADLLTESPLEYDLDDDLLELERGLQFGSNKEKTNLDTYLDDDREKISAFTEMEVLDFWKDKQHKYGDLALLARDVLSIPITTVASESAFSVGGRVLNPFRNRLLPKSVQALICTRNWLHGFAEFGGNIDEFFDYDDEDADKKASSSGIEDSSI